MQKQLEYLLEDSRFTRNHGTNGQEVFWRRKDSNEILLELHFLSIYVRRITVSDHW